MFFRVRPLIVARCWLITAFLAACAPALAAPVNFPTYDPFLPNPTNTLPPSTIFPTVTITNTPTATRAPTPTRVPLTVSPLPPPPPPNMLIVDVPADTPTPDAQRVLPTPRQNDETYTVQAGDTLGSIAQQHGISVATLMQANNIADANLLTVGTTLNIPAPKPSDAGPAFKIVPNSEMVNGPASVYFDIEKFINSQNGYLETYEQEVNGVTIAGYQAVQIVARNYSVNPRLLLALLEYQSGWVTNPTPLNTDYPMGFADENHRGLYRQLTWAANSLNHGYYAWKANTLSAYVLNDGTVAPVNPTINAGTAAIQYFFSQFDDRPTWEHDVSGTGLLLTYYVFFGNPFDYAIEPLISPSVAQPPMRLPFSAKETWYFTGGPHGGWDIGSAYAALDFAPPGDNGNCATSPLWVTAIADGFVLRASNGGLFQDLDNDGYEQTGWVIFYMHVAEQDRIAPGEYIYAGEHVGHPSCEGGVANATHLHIARKFNGEWIAADSKTLPFNLDGWIASGTGKEYDGFLKRGAQTIEALNSASELNQIAR